MTIIASMWLFLAIIMCAFAWLAGKRFAAISLPLAVSLAALAIYVPTGTPRLTAPPPGKYTVLGSLIAVNVAIYALLDDGKGEPRYYKLPYSNAAANSLQSALDGAQNGAGVKANIDGSGGASFDGPAPVTGDPPKIPETAQVSVH